MPFSLRASQKIYLVSSKLLAPFLGYLTLHSHVPHNHVVLHMFSLTFASKPCDIKSESQPHFINLWLQPVYFFISITYHVLHISIVSLCCIMREKWEIKVTGNPFHSQGYQNPNSKKVPNYILQKYQNVRVNGNASMKSFCCNKKICL